MRSARIHARDGVLMVCVLVCLIVSAAIVAATTRTALRGRRSVRSEHQLRQTELLLDAGVHRAKRQLQTSEAYQGETWQAGKVGRFGNGQVVIRVTLPEQGARVRDVEVVASLAADDGEPVSNRSVTQRSHRFSIPLIESNNNSESQNAE